MDEEDPKKAYMEGRLRGLAELISILKETLDSSDAPASSVLLKSIVSHVSKEVDSILADFEERHGEHPLLEKAQDMHADLSKAASSRKEPTLSDMKKQVDVADDLMKNLMTFKAQKGKLDEEEPPHF